RPAVTGRHVLVDTSISVALAGVSHEVHDQVAKSLAGLTLGLSGHAAFETFSVLTRLPPPLRRPPTAVARLIAANFPESRFIGPEATRRLLEQLAELGIAGGSVYDALVGAAAAEHNLPLVTRDQRALETYRALNIRHEILS
ncbi:MAG TPA: PIN domain-containing protein, partial [Actinomycetota bacterium]|nr:PIN domain-containing protein [Actinomycetota bacterium]